LGDQTTKKQEEYIRVYNLVRHEQQRSTEDFLERTVMAVFLLRTLQQIAYFGQNTTAGKLLCMVSGAYHITSFALHFINSI